MCLSQMLECAYHKGVSWDVRSIQRDIKDIRTFLDSEVESTGVVEQVIYDRMSQGYRLEQI